ncbi:hypothetical protein NBRC116583_02280 [Arenicella sp. 4NH20-0111]|uniref:PqqD family protein n=1 Tax=Arenicella sp. 4NH20-0111 TaxID=3127648 RepID=UPI0031069712
MSNQEIYRQADNCLVEEMGGEVLLYNPDTATTLHLNAPSIIVWQLCTGENTVGELIEALQEAYPDQDDQIESDVVEAIASLHHNKVLIRVSGDLET